MDIKTLYYLANFEHNFDDFKQRLDELFKNDDENSEYKLNLITPAKENFVLIDTEEVDRLNLKKQQ